MYKPSDKPSLQIISQIQLLASFECVSVRTQPTFNLFNHKRGNNNFVKGWISSDILNTLKNHYNSNLNNNLLTEWSNRTITFIYRLWKQRNKLWKKWELDNGITNVEKRRKIVIKILFICNENESSQENDRIIIMIKLK